MDVKLKVVAGANTGQEVPVGGSKFFIGRAEDCQLRPKSDLISRHHCVILVETDLLAIRDLGSRNGTYVNDERVQGERALRAGDRLKVGPLEFEIHLAETPAPTRRPPVTSIHDAVVRMAQSASAAIAPDDDVSRWLGDEPEVTGSTAETRELKETATPDPTRQTVAASGLDTTAMDVTSSDTNATPTVPKKPKPPSSADSGKAAGDVLRNFFKRR